MAFNIPSQWGFAKATPSSALKTWTRPSDWPVITDTANEVQFLVSNAQFLTYPLRTSFTRPAAENIYVDWGDGTTDTITTTADTWTTHTYSAATGGTGGTGGTPSSRGYNTWTVRVYTDPGVAITQCVFDVNTTTPVIPFVTSQITVNCGVLEMYYGDGIGIPTYNSFLQTASRGMVFNFLEYVKFPSDMSSVIATNTVFTSTFGSSAADFTSSLAKVVMPTNLGTTFAQDFTETFINCFSLLELTFPATCKIRNFTSTFQTCPSLQSVTFPTNSNPFEFSTSWSSAFNGCILLSTINNMPTSLQVCTDFSSTFTNCFSLNNIVIPTFGVGTITMTSAFSTCVSLRQVSFAGWNAGTVWQCTQMFQTCPSLLNVTFPVGADFSNLTNCFLSCNNLRSVVFQSSCPSLTNLSNTFQNCFSLQSVTLPSTVNAAGATLSNTFNGCYSLESFSFPNGFAPTSMVSSFLNCYSLKTITLPSLSSLGSVSMLQCFSNCSALQSVVFSNTAAIGSLQATFQGCSSLQSVVFPSTLNNCSTMSSTFSSCKALQSVTMPTSMSTCGSFLNTFQFCSSLKTLTMPATVSNATAYSSLCAQCFSLTTVTLPSTQTTNLTAAGNMFTRCANLTTITNLDKIGSTSPTGTVLAGFGSAATQSLYGTYSLTSISLSCRLAQFFAGGVNNASTIPNKVTSVRLTNTGTGQWTGGTPQINVAYTNLSTAALNILFADIAAQGSVTSKTINITSSTGAAGLTAADRLVITSLGWTITG